MVRCAQVAGQQGAYVARMINRGYVPGRGGLTAPFPCRQVDAPANSQVHPVTSPSRNADLVCATEEPLLGLLCAPASALAGHPRRAGLQRCVGAERGSCG